MAWEQDTFDAKATPIVGKIGEGDPPFFLLAICMAFVLKTINTLKLANVALIILALVLVDDLLLEFQRVREERITCGSWY